MMRVGVICLESIIVRGGKPLYGEVGIQGSKNAALPIMAAAVLVSGECVLKGCPDIADVDCMCHLLRHIGGKVERSGDALKVDASVLTQHDLPERYVKGMRSSVMLMSPLLARLGEAGLHYPGGCVIGDRPIDLHLDALRKLGVFCQEMCGQVYACVGNMKATKICLPFPSVGATETAIMAAVYADGVTVVENCAREPEIYWLCEFLKAAGAEVELVCGKHAKAIIHGGKPLHACSFRIPSDRIVAGTYLCACMAAGGEVFLRNAPRQENGAAEQLAARMGAELEWEKDGILVRMKQRPVSPGKIVTACYPGFPTDLQSPLLPVLAVASGMSRIQESIFNGRFGAAGQLNRMGAGIVIVEDTAEIPGSRQLHGEVVSAADLRGGAALVVAALCAEGVSVVTHCHYIERGYEDICRDLKILGADMEKE